MVSVRLMRKDASGDCSRGVGNHKGDEMGRAVPAEVERFVVAERLREQAGHDELRADEETNLLLARIVRAS